MDSQIRLVIDRRAPFADGQTFGDAGGYELLSGRVDFAVDPAAAEFSAVVDLEHAPRNADGLVEYSADVYMLKPLDLERGNGRIFYDVNNRGNLRCLQFFNDAGARQRAVRAGTRRQRLPDATRLHRHLVRLAGRHQPRRGPA